MILAIDQGSSKTSAALVSMNGTILASATSGGACYFCDGVETAFKEIHKAVGLAAEKAVLYPLEITRVYGGIAGANWPDEIEMLKKEIQTRFNTQNVDVCNDCVVALRGGTDKPNAIILCAGTAFNGAVMTDGKIRYVFNNYIAPADQGGGALGSRALQAVFDSHIGIREKTVLTKMLLVYYGYDNTDQLLLGRDRNRLKYPLQTIAPLLMEAACQNDGVALEIITEFAKSIARYATGGLKKYDLSGKDCDIVLSGGIFKSKHPLLVETISAEIRRVSCQARVVNAEFEPVVGAALFGLIEAGAKAGEIEQCKKSARTLGLVRIITNNYQEK